MNKKTICISYNIYMITFTDLTILNINNQRDTLFENEYLIYIRYTFYTGYLNFIFTLCKRKIWRSISSKYKKKHTYFKYISYTHVLSEYPNLLNLAGFRTWSILCAITRKPGIFVIISHIAVHFNLKTKKWRELLL